jgi:hypothetical protein
MPGTGQIFWQRLPTVDWFLVRIDCSPQESEMSRWSRDDDRGDGQNAYADRESEARRQERIQDHVDDLPMDGLTLPRGDERETVHLRDREYELSGSDTRALATVGAFRVVVSEDLVPREKVQDTSQHIWKHLADQGLLTRETLTDRAGARHVVALTRNGRALLDAHRGARQDGRRQEYYARVVKPRELRHDAQLYLAYRAEATRIERDGGRVTRVVLDYELKRDYQKFLNRKGRSEGSDVRVDRQAFAQANGLSVVRDHLELPDLRIEYEDEYGRHKHRDVELVTEHYSRGQLAGKAKAGFVRYRSSSSGGHGSDSRRGGTPHDPRHLERLS